MTRCKVDLNMSRERIGQQAPREKISDRLTVTPSLKEIANIHDDGVLKRRNINEVSFTTWVLDLDDFR